MLFKESSRVSGSLKDEKSHQLGSEPDRVENLALLCLGVNMGGGWEDGSMANHQWLCLDGVAPQTGTLISWLAVTSSRNCGNSREGTQGTCDFCPSVHSSFPT